MWLCRSPRMSPSSISCGSVAAPRGLELAAVLAQLRLDVGQAEPRVDLLLARAASASPPSRRRGSPYSETCRPRRTAASRSAALCRPEPVKCCSRLPSCAGARDAQVDGHARRACAPARPPSAGGADALDLLEAREALARAPSGRRVDGDEVDVLDAVRAGGGSSRRAARRASGAGALAAARRRSLRRARRARGEQHARRAPVGCAAAARAPASTLSSNFGPSPRTVRSAARAPPRAAPASESMPSSECSSRARLGPRPGRRVIVDQARRELRAQLLGGGDRAGLDERHDLLLQRLADARQLGRAALRARAPATDTEASRTALAALR